MSFVYRSIHSCKHANMHVSIPKWHVCTFDYHSLCRNHIDSVLRYPKLHADLYMCKLTVIWDWFQWYRARGAIVTWWRSSRYWRWCWGPSSHLHNSWRTHHLRSFIYTITNHFSGETTQWKHAFSKLLRSASTTHLFQVMFRKWHVMSKLLKTYPQRTIPQNSMATGMITPNTIKLGWIEPLLSVNIKNRYIYILLVTGGEYFVLVA